MLLSLVAFQLSISVSKMHEQHAAGFVVDPSQKNIVKWFLRFLILLVLQAIYQCLSD